MQFIHQLHNDRAPPQKKKKKERKKKKRKEKGVFETQSYTDFYLISDLKPTMCQKKTALAFLLAVQLPFLYFYLHVHEDPSTLAEKNPHNMQTSRSKTVLSRPQSLGSSPAVAEIPMEDFVLSVAVGLAITTKRSKPLVSSPVGIKCPFFKSLLPSFCKTASKGYNYRFYLAYDAQDKHLKENSFKTTFVRAFNDYVTGHCPRNSSYSIKLVRCDHTGKPAWAQNDAMIDAYLDDVDYYYRVNDDTVMQTSGWTEKFIHTLVKGSHPHVGVVGPFHIGGNMKILTYDFVHKTHLDIFGFYYPRLFGDWYADRWITDVYKPNMSTKLRSVKLRHTMENGQRYALRAKGVRKNVDARIKADKATLKR